MKREKKETNSKPFELDDLLNKDFPPRLQKDIERLLEHVQAGQIQYTSKDGKKINIGYDSDQT